MVLLLGAQVERYTSRCTAPEASFFYSVMSLEFQYVQREMLKKIFPQSKRSILPKKIGEKKCSLHRTL